MSLPSQTRTNHRAPPGTSLTPQEIRKEREAGLKAKIAGLEAQIAVLTQKIGSIDDLIIEKEKEVKFLRDERARLLKETMKEIPSYLYTRPGLCAQEISGLQVAKANREKERKEKRWQLERVQEQLESLI